MRNEEDREIAQEMVHRLYSIGSEGQRTRSDFYSDLPIGIKTVETLGARGMRGSTKDVCPIEFIWF